MRTAARGWTDLRKSIAAVGELLLLQARATTWASSASTTYMRKYGFGAADRHRPGRREPAASCRRRNGSASARKEHVVSRRNRDRRHRPGLLGRDDAAARARRRGDRQRRRPACARTWSPRAATATTRRGCRCRSPPRRASPTTPRNLRAVQEGMIGDDAARRHRLQPRARRAVPDGGQDRHRAEDQPQAAASSVDPHQLPFHLRHQALFVGYAPADNPTIAVAVTVEHGGFGASTAGPIARKIFDAWLLGKMPEVAPIRAGPGRRRGRRRHRADAGTDAALQRRSA